MKLTVRSMTIKAVPFSYINGKMSFDGVVFEKTDNGLTPVFQDFEIHADWLREANGNQHLWMQHVGVIIVYVMDKRWQINPADKPPLISIQIDEGGNLVMTSTPKQFNFLFSSDVVFKD